MKDCFKKANDQKNGSNLDTGSLAIAASYKEAGAHIGIAYVSSIERSDQNWVLDLSCSFHMSPNISLFYDFSNFDGGFLKLKNNVSCTLAIFF